MVPSVLVGLCLSSLFLAGCAATDPAPAHASYTEQVRGSDVSFDMVWIPEAGFWMGKTEVTWDEYLLYCDFDHKHKLYPGADAVTKPSEPLPDVSPYDRDWGLGKRPAVGMSWNAAKKYCQWLSLNTGTTYRLPTEAEWKLACGPLPEPLVDSAWIKEDSDDMTHPVGQKRPNRFGLYDVFGNVWEYAWNPYSPDEPKRAVLRGGSWATKGAQLTPDSRLRFEDDWVLDDPNVPPGVWWVPDGDDLGIRLIRVPDK